GHEGPIHHVTASPNGQWAVSVGADKGVRIWNLSDQELQSTLEGHTAEVTQSAIRNDSGLLATGDAEGMIRIASPLEPLSLGSLGSPPGPIRGLAFHNNNQHLISVGEAGLVKVWQLPIPPSRLLEGHTDAAVAVVTTSDNQRVITGGLDETIRI